jgi:hypothetical protein
MQNKSSIINGGFFEDFRGRLDYLNDFDLSIIKEIYFTMNPKVGFLKYGKAIKGKVDGVFVLREVLG